MRELRERAEPLLKAVWLILALLVAWQLVGVIRHWNPFRGAVVPELPTLTAATNSPAGGGSGTNSLATSSKMGTNSTAPLSSTNAIKLAATTNANLSTNTGSMPKPGEKGSNSMAYLEIPAATNVLTTNAAVTAVTTTNALTNSATSTPANATTNSATNVVASPETKAGGSNSVMAVVSTNGGTNLTLSIAAAGTNDASSSKSKRAKSSSGPMPGMPGMPGMGSMPGQPPGKRGPDLPPAVQARITKIYESEILGPVIRPLPMALLGIAGNVAFLRSDSGQTGLVKEGDSLDNLKVLRIGINRVLIEQDGQKKELTIFSGYGSESLMQNDSTNENKHL